MERGEAETHAQLKDEGRRPEMSDYIKTTEINNACNIYFTELYL